MADFKIEVFACRDEDPVEADRRGDKFKGKEQGNEHRTVWERPNIPEDEVDFVIAAAERFNLAVMEAVEELAEEVGVDMEEAAGLAHKLLGGDGNADSFGIAGRVYDK